MAVGSAFQRFALSQAQESSFMGQALMGEYGMPAGPPTGRGAPAQVQPPAYMQNVPQISNWEGMQQNIFPGESGGDYNALFGFSQRPGGQFAGTTLTDMTVNQALDFANPSGQYGQWVAGQNNGTVATPMGAYQVVGSTLRAAKNGLGLTGNEKMTPELQDSIGKWIYANQGPEAWEAWGKAGGGGAGVTMSSSGPAMPGGPGPQMPEELMPANDPEADARFRQGAMLMGLGQSLSALSQGDQADMSGAIRMIQARKALAQERAMELFQERRRQFEREQDQALAVANREDMQQHATSLQDRGFAHQDSTAERDRGWQVSDTLQGRGWDVADQNTMRGWQSADAEEARTQQVDDMLTRRNWQKADIEQARDWTLADAATNRQQEVADLFQQRDWSLQDFERNKDLQFSTILLSDNLAQARARQEAEMSAGKLTEAYRTKQQKAVAGGLEPGTTEYQDFMLDRDPNGGVPSAFQTLHLRAQASGLTEGSPEYQEFMSTGGSKHASNKEAQIARIMETNVDRDTAIGLVDGILYPHRNETTQKLELKNLATGETVFDGWEGFSGTLGQASLPVGEGDESGTMANTDMSSMFGLEGSYKGFVNSAADYFHLGNKYPGAANAKAALDKLGYQTIASLTADIAGRPSVWTQQKVEGILPNNASGPAGALNNTRELRGMIDNQRERIKAEILDQPQLQSPQNVAEARARYNSLTALSQLYGDLETGLSRRRQERPSLSSYGEP